MTYTIADVFRPDLGSSADGLTVEAFRVSTWGGTHNPPHLGDTPPVSPPFDVSGTTGTTFGDHGAWELALNYNEDYFVGIEYSSTWYWKRYNCPAWTDGATGELDMDAATVAGVNAYGVDLYDGDVQGVGVTASASVSNDDSSFIQLMAAIDHVHPGLGLPIGATGATGATRFVGGTSSGAPGSGTFAVGDFVIDQTGALWVCTGSGSPGTWINIAPGSAYSGAPGDIKAIASLVVPSGWNACDGSAISRTTYADLWAALTFPSSAAGSPVTSLTGHTNSDTSITNITVNGTSGGANANLQVGWPIEGTGIPSGATITAINSDTQITISTNATSTASGVALTVAPWGFGDGSTTFNVPDLRGHVPVGSGTGAGESSSDGGDSGSGKPTGSSLTSRSLGTWFGQEQHLLAYGESGVPEHAHTTSDLGHSHGPEDGFEGFLATTGGAAISYAGGDYTLGQASATATGYADISLAESGAGVPADAGASHNVVQPSSTVQYVIKLDNGYIPVGPPAEGAPYCLAYNSTSDSVEGYSTFTQVTLESIEASGYGLTVVSNGIKIATAGLYHIDWMVTLPDGTEYIDGGDYAGIPSGSIYLNGSMFRPGSVAQAAYNGGSFGGGGGGGCEGVFAVDDLITLWVFYNPAATTTTVTGRENTYLHMFYIGPA